MCLARIYTCHFAYEWVTLNINQPHKLVIVTYEGVMSHINEASNTSSICNVIYLYVTTPKHVAHWHVTCLIHVWHDSFLRNMTNSYVTSLIYMRHVLSMCDLTHSYRHDSFIRDMTHSYVAWLILKWHDSSIRDMTQSYVKWLSHTWHDSFIRDMKF